MGKKAASLRSKWQTSTRKPHLVFAADGRRGDLFLGLLRVVHRVLRSLDGVVQIVFVDFQVRTIRRVLLENGKKLFGARGHQIDAFADVLLLFDAELYGVGRVIHASDVGIEQRV